MIICEIEQIPNYNLLWFFYLYAALHEACNALVPSIEILRFQNLPNSLENPLL
ncbi:hypothetical protein [Helicobacter pullorum]|uniref:hypothetical protein n=1 Tax=Helicobacter pullorum TaxID=35818 RepID=UPI00242BDD25|nr:hypothetical protein [Helicobacter pullorum]